MRPERSRTSGNAPGRSAARGNAVADRAVLTGRVDPFLHQRCLVPEIRHTVLSLRYGIVVRRIGVGMSNGGCATTPSGAAAPALARGEADTGWLMWWAVLAALCTALIAPLVVCEIPPLADYPNHLARWFILASLPGDAALARFYAPHWSVIPNLALDVMAPPLMRILPVHVAGRVMIAASVLLPVLGAVAYGRALGGRWWPLGAGLLAHCNCLMYGFLNFSFSLGLALLLAAAWLCWQERFPIATIVLAVVGAPMLFACHLMGLVFFGFL